MHHLMMLNFQVHIRRVTQMDGVRERWKLKWGRYPNEEDVERMYKNYVPIQLRMYAVTLSFRFVMICLNAPVAMWRYSLPQHAEMITGAVDTVSKLRVRFCSCVVYPVRASRVLPGCVASLVQSNWGLKIGSTTGFTRDMINIIKVTQHTPIPSVSMFDSYVLLCSTQPIAAKAGYTPDCYVCADEVPQARPYPYMVT